MSTGTALRYGTRFTVAADVPQIGGNKGRILSSPGPAASRFYIQLHVHDLGARGASMKDDRLTTAVLVRFTANEAQELSERAAREGRTRSNYVRWIVRAELTQQLTEERTNDGN